MVHIEVVNSAIPNPFTHISNPFTNAIDDDVVFYPSLSNYNIHIGCQSQSQSNMSMIQISTSNVVIQGDLYVQGALSASNIIGSNVTCSNAVVGILTVPTLGGSNITAGTIAATNITGCNVSASETLQTSGICRITDKGQLRNVSACNGSNVTIDTSCLTGVLPLARGGTGAATSATTGTSNLVFSTGPTLCNPICNGTMSAAAITATSLTATATVTADTLIATSNITTPFINVANRGELKFDFGYYAGAAQNGTISFSVPFSQPPVVTTSSTGGSSYWVFNTQTVPTTTGFTFWSYSMTWTSGNVLTGGQVDNEPFYWAAIGI